MKRRVILIACTFAVLLLGLLIYQWVTTGRITFGIHVSHSSEDSGTVVTKPGGGFHFPGPGKQLYIEDRKPDGHLDAIYEATQWEKISDTTYKLIEPRIHMFTRAGTEVDVTARQGIVEAQELAKGENLRHGSLSGDVKIVYDPSTESQRIPWEQRPDEVVRILVDHISFDNDRLMIETDSEVQVYSPQADMLGKGLLLSWNQAPQELAELRIDHGRQIIVKKVPAELTPALPTGSDTVVTDAGAGQARVDHASGGGPAAAPPTQPSVATTQPGAGSDQVHKPPQKAAQNMMEAVLTGSDKLIDIEHGQQSVHGAKTLKFQFDWDQSKGRPGAPGARTANASGAPAKPSPAGPGPIAASKPVPESPQEHMVITWEGPLVVKPVGYTPTPSNKNYVVRGEGEDVRLTDVGAKAVCAKFDMTSPQQDAHLYGSAFKPAHMELSTGEIIDCQAMHYYHQGEKEKRVGIADLSGPGVMVRRATTRPAGATVATGAGAALPGKEIAVVSTPAPDGKGIAATVPAEQDRITLVPAEDRIFWATSVHAVFVPDSPGREPLAAAPVDKTAPRPAAGTQAPFGTRTREHLSEATFEGNVNLFQSATGDFLNSDHLHVTMSRGKNGQDYPSVAEATGNVKGRFRSTDNPDRPQVTLFSSQEGTLHFKEDANPQSKSPAQPSIFEARKDVTFIYGPDASAPGAGKADAPVTGKADSMIGDVAAHTAVLYGKPASLTQGTNVLTGGQIELDQYSGTPPSAKPVRKASGPTAYVHGPGKLNFTSDRDINGNPLATSRPVQVTWTKEMVYDGNVKPEVIAKGDTNVVITARATFTGDVVFDSEPKAFTEHEEHGRDHLQSQEMVISFADRSATTQPVAASPVAAAPAAQPPAPAALVPVAALSSANDAQPGKPVLPVGPSQAPSRSPPPVAAATSRPAGGSLDMQFSNRSVVSMTARKQVVLNSCRMLKDERPGQADREQEFVVRREEVKCDDLLYDAIANKVSITGAGDMVAEDYRPPAAGAGDKEKAQAAAGDDNQMQPPYQFFATWKDGMTMEQNTRTVTLNGRVTGGYRGGAQMLLRDSIKMQPMPQLPPGQIFNGTCNRMVARFYPPQAQGQAKPANFDEGPRLGPPRTIDAFDKVNMTVDATGKPKVAGESPEPTWQIFGDRIHYERPADANGNPIVDQPAIAFVQALPDANGQFRNAQVAHQDKLKGVSDSVVAPRIDMTIKDGEIVKVEAKKITGAR